MQGPGREPAQLQEKLQEFGGGGSCFLRKMQLCWEGFVMLRGHTECWKWGRKKYCLTPRRSFSSLSKMTESPLATVSSHFSFSLLCPLFSQFVRAKSDETDGLLHRLSKQREDGNSASFTHSLRFELEQNQFHFPSPLCVIAVSPKIIDISPDVSINEGGNVSLTCIATGRPDPTITWRHISPKGKNQTLPEIFWEGHSALCEWLGRG